MYFLWEFKGCEFFAIWGRPRFALFSERYVVVVFSLFSLSLTITSAQIGPSHGASLSLGIWYLSKAQWRSRKEVWLYVCKEHVVGSNPLRAKPNTCISVVRVWYCCLHTKVGNNISEQYFSVSTHRHHKCGMWNVYAYQIFVRLARVHIQVQALHVPNIDQYIILPNKIVFFAKIPNGKARLIELFDYTLIGKCS